MKIRKFYDIIVVGGGPAGGTAALYAAKKGAKVIILERDREIGIPVRCAEGISKRGLTRIFKPNNKWICNKIEGAMLYAPNGESCLMTAETVGDGYILERRIFDSYICQQAAQYNTDILTKADVYDLLIEDKKIKGVKFKHYGENKSIKANIIIAADGPESYMARKAGLKTNLKLSDIESSAQYLLTNIKVEKKYCHFFFGNQIAPGGYIWIFPKGNNTANVGIGVRQDRTNKGNAKELLDDFIEKNFPDSKEISFIAGCVPIAKTLPRITADNFMIVGDAARQLNPVTGGGLSNSLFAGSIAGETAAMAVKKNNFTNRFLKRYHRLWMKEKGKKQSVHYNLKEVFFNLSDRRLNEIVKIIQDIPKEKLTLFQLFKTAIKGHPILTKELIKAYIK